MTNGFLLPMQMPNFDAAIRDAKNGSPEARLVAAIALGRIRDGNEPKAIDALRDLARDPVEEVRAQALEGIGEQMRGGADVPEHIILKAVSDPCPRVRLAAVENMPFGKNDGATDTLISMLSDSDPSVRATTCRVLGEMKEPNAREAICRLLEDGTPFVTYESAMALAELGDSRGESVLIQMLESAGDLAIDAAYSLGKIGSKRLSPSLRAVANKRFVGPELKAMAAAALVRSGGEDGREILKRVLTSRRQNTKLIVLGTLARLPVKDMVSVVALLLDDKRSLIVSATIRTLCALAEIDKDKALQALLSRKQAMEGELSIELGEALASLY